MNKRMVKGLSCMLAVLMLTGCGNQPASPQTTTKPSDPVTVEEHSNIGNPLAKDKIKLLSFDYHEVTLNDGLFKQVYDGCMAYYDEITADDILYRWRKVSGMDTGTGRDLGWEAGTTNAECCLAQLVSAKARRYAITGEEKDLQTVKDILTGYQEILDKTGTYPLMFSAYFYEKTLRAFIDCYTYCGLEQGYEMAKSFVSYGMSTSPFKEPKKLLGDNQTEWYTMSEALYLFAELAKEKGEPATAVKQYLEFAKLYEYTQFWDIFYNDENIFDYSPEIDAAFNEWFHAYSHLNSFNSALEAYRQTGKAYYLEASQKFYEWAQNNQKQVTGGYGAQWEWLLPAELQVGYLKTTDRSTETQCNAYAIVNMDNYLTTYTGSGAYGQWTEDAFYNMTIASLETADGCPTYYSDYSSDGGTKYLREDWPWACCAGTRPLVVMEYLRNIYYHDTQNLYVNLYTNSSVELINSKGNTVALTQNSAFPEESIVTFTINTSETEPFAVCFRQPQWIASDAVITVNGQTVDYVAEEGWMVVNRQWSDRDTVTVELPMKLQYSVMQAQQSGEAIYAVTYGPVTLACAGIQNDLSEVLPMDTDPNGLLTRQEGTLQFTANENEQVVLIPYYAYEAGEKYILYISAD